MKKNYPYKQICFLLLAIFIVSCNGENKTHLAESIKNESPTVSVKESEDESVKSPAIIRSSMPQGYYAYERDSSQVSQYIRRIFQDSKGDLWFGTNDDGVCRYNRKSLTYFTIKEGLAGNAVRGIVEDKFGNLWFGTSGGVSKYDGTNFTNYTEKDGLIVNDVWHILIDKKGTLWVATYEGVCRINLLDGKENRFTSFPIPPAFEIDKNRTFSPNLVWYLMEDKAENIWFATHGGGAYRYDGISLTNISVKDGLNDNFVYSIMQDRRGDIWFATKFKGVCRYSGKSFTNYTEKEGLSANEVWSTYEEKSGNIWFTSKGNGVYRYDGKAFTNFTQKDGLTNLAIQSIFEDKSGKLWFGSGAGLFRFDGKSFVNVKQIGPWK